MPQIKDVIEVILHTDTARFSPGDLMGQAEMLEDVYISSQLAIITGIMLLDYDSRQGGDLDLLLFRTDPGYLGTVNTPIALTGEQAEMLFGVVHISALDYTMVGVPRIAQPRISPIMVPEDGASIWIAAVDRFGSIYASGRLLLRVSVTRYQRE